MRVAERRVRKLAGTTKKDGTDDWQMLEAIRALGLTAEPLLSESRSAAWAFVRSSLSSGRAVAICVDDYEHWVTIIGLVGDRVIVADPVRTKQNKQENGIHSMTRTDLLRRWLNKKRGEHYAIAVGRKR